MRIISEELWAKCELRKNFSRVQSKKITQTIINPLRGLVFCGVCESTKIIANKKRYVCSGYKSHRVCRNARGLKYEKIIDLVFDYLKAQLQSKSSGQRMKDFKIILSQLEQFESTNDEISKIDEKVNAMIDLFDNDNIDIQKLKDKIRQLSYKKSHMITNRNNVAIEFDSDLNTFLSKGLADLYNALAKPQNDDLIRVYLLVLIKKITMHPIENQRNGETIQIEMNDDAWITFYRLILQTPIPEPKSDVI